MNTLSTPTASRRFFNTFVFGFAAISLVATANADQFPQTNQTRFSAVQQNGVVTVTATGMNPTGGYHTSMTSRLKHEHRFVTYEFYFTNTPPNGPATRALKPYRVQASLKAQRPLRSVIVYANHKRQVVAVEQGRGHGHSQPQFQLGRASYEAYRVNGGIKVVASGTNSSAGWQNMLKAEPSVGTPQLKFLQARPQGFVSQVVRPFRIEKMVSMPSHTTSHVVVQDAQGRKFVPVRGNNSSPGNGSSQLMPGKANYRAVQTHGGVVVFASGTNPSAGYRNELQAGQRIGDVPTFKFLQARPTGFVSQVVTPFNVRSFSRATNSVDHVIVKDARGVHYVKVERHN